MEIHLLHTNDVHSQLENYMRLASKLRHMRQDLMDAGKAVLTFDIGDILDRVRPETEATLGLLNATLMGALGYDGWVFGNNEGLTIPIEHWASLVEYSGAITFGSNYRTRQGAPLPFFADTHVYEIQGIRIGVCGVTPNYDVAYENLGVSVLDPFAVVANLVPQLREQSDIVVVLSHLGLREDRKLATQVPDIDVILGGHTHQFMEQAEQVGNTYIFQPGKHALKFGHTLIDFDENNGKVRQVMSEPMAVDLHGSEDALLQDTYESVLPVIERELSQFVTQLEMKLPVSFRDESPFANLLADALFEAYPCDLAMIMSGALTGSMLPGSVQAQHIHGACSTPTRPLLMTLTGEEVLSIMRKAIQPQYYAQIGFGYGFRGSVVGYMALANADAELKARPDGQMQLQRLTVAGEEIDPTRDYRVVTCEYLWLAPVFEEFQGGRDVRIEAPLLREVLRANFDKPHLHARANEFRYQIQ